MFDGENWRQPVGFEYYLFLTTRFISFIKSVILENVFLSIILFIQFEWNLFIVSFQMRWSLFLLKLNLSLQGILIESHTFIYTVCILDKSKTTYSNKSKYLWAWCIAE